MGATNAFKSGIDAPTFSSKNDDYAPNDVSEKTVDATGWPSGNFAYWTALLDKAETKRQQQQSSSSRYDPSEPSFSVVHERNDHRGSSHDPLSCLDSSSSSSADGGGLGSSGSSSSSSVADEHH